MSFNSVAVKSEIQCEWQSEKKAAIRPDFFIKRPNGYSDIVEFKLPSLKNNTVVGINNRETFSAELNSYIAQTRVYTQYFNDPNNREWVSKHFDIKVKNPKRTLVIGRRRDFLVDDWKDILDEFNNLEIITCDDLVDGVVAQFYL